MTRTIHVCVDIVGLLQKPDGCLVGFVENGRDLSPREVREKCVEMLRQGFDYIPAVGCDDFDERGRCRGHDT